MAAIRIAYFRGECVCQSGVAEPTSGCESQVQRYLAGDQEAKEAATIRLQEMFNDPVRAVARTILLKVSGESILDDAVQEVWKNVFGRTRTKEPQLLKWINRPVHESACPCKLCRGPFCAWLSRTARNASLTIYRRESVRGQREKVLPDDAPTEDVTASDERGRRENQEEVQECLKQLSEDDQRLYTLKFVEEKNPGECAAILGIAEETYHFRKRKLLERLRRCLEGRRER